MSTTGTSNVNTKGEPQPWHTVAFHTERLCLVLPGLFFVATHPQGILQNAIGVLYAVAFLVIDTQAVYQGWRKQRKSHNAMSLIGHDGKSKLLLLKWAVATMVTCLALELIFGYLLLTGTQKQHSTNVICGAVFVVFANISGWNMMVWLGEVIRMEQQHRASKPVTQQVAFEPPRVPVGYSATASKQSVPNPLRVGAGNKP